VTGGGDASVDEALAFIAAHPHVYLLGRRADGFPTGYAMMSKVRDGAVEFSTYRASAKVRNLLRDGHAGILAVSKVDDAVLSATGPVTLADSRHWLDADPSDGPTVTPDFRPSVPSDIGTKVAARHDDGRRCVLRVTIERAHYASKLE